eukprot:GDKK01018439.1.p1 GENE.GDKK01018439.1~~GDKK01018439.1.p1  ORF type:complete len:670 (+),score=135.98 GDKK01018439.1:254-2011(+)
MCDVSTAASPSKSLAAINQFISAHSHDPHAPPTTYPFLNDTTSSPAFLSRPPTPRGFMPTTTNQSCSETQVSQLITAIRFAALWGRLENFIVLIDNLRTHLSSQFVPKVTASSTSSGPSSPIPPHSFILFNPPSKSSASPAAGMKSPSHSRAVSMTSSQFLSSSAPLSLLSKTVQEAFKLASSNNQINILIYLLSSPNFVADKSIFELSFVSECVQIASKNGHLDIIQWWLHAFKSHSTLLFTTQALEDALSNSHIHILTWWKESCAATALPTQTHRHSNSMDFPMLQTGGSPSTTTSAPIPQVNHTATRTRISLTLTRLIFLNQTKVVAWWLQNFPSSPSSSSPSSFPKGGAAFTIPLANIIQIPLNEALLLKASTIAWCRHKNIKIDVNSNHSPRSVVRKQNFPFWAAFFVNFHFDFLNWLLDSGCSISANTIQELLLVGEPLIDAWFVENHFVEVAWNHRSERRSSSKKGKGDVVAATVNNVNSEKEDRQLLKTENEKITTVQEPMKTTIRKAKVVFDTVGIARHLLKLHSEGCCQELLIWWGRYLLKDSYVSDNEDLDRFLTIIKDICRENEEKRLEKLKI